MLSFDFFQVHISVIFSAIRQDETAVKVLTEMFEASVDGEAYDAERWSNYFRPAGMAARTGDPTKAASSGATAMSQSAPAAPTPAATPVAAPADDIPFKSTEEAAAEAAPAAGGAQDILSMIRARQG